MFLSPLLKWRKPTIIKICLLLQPLKKVFEILSPESNAIIQPVLNIRLGEKHFSCAITAFSSKHCHALAYWTDDDVSHDSVKELLNKDIISGHAFYRVNICYDYGNNMLVPAGGFSYEDAGYAKLSNAALSVTVTELISEWQLYNVYTVPGDIHSLLSGKYPAAKQIHQVTLGLKNINAALHAGCIQVDIRHHDFSLIAAKARKLLLAQSFEYTNPEDVIYYLLKACHEFSLSQNEVLVNLSGLFDKQSVLYKDLYQYFANINIREAEWQLPRTEYPPHFFTSLNELAKCEL